MEKDKDCNCPEHEMEAFTEANSESTPEMEDGANLEQFSTSEAPSEMPPEEENANEAFGSGTWHNNKKVNALWSRNETRNSWAGFSGLGWKKLNSSNDSSCVAMTILTAHARQFNRNTKIKIDNNEVKEIYVW